MMTTHESDLQNSVPDQTETVLAWRTPVLTKLKVEDAEAGGTNSENGAVGS